MNLILSLLSGIIAAFSPCVIVLIPLLLFRFVNKEKTEWVSILWLILGFLISYIIFAYFLSSIFTSAFQNGVKLGAGILFIVLGVLSLMKKINPLNFPLIKNPFLFGVFFALIVSFNPCTIPFLSVVVALNTVNLILHLVFFALGLLLPTIFFVVFGQKFLGLAKKTEKMIVIVDKLMNFILIGAGVYLIILIKALNKFDVYVAALLLVLIFFILLKSFFVINSKKDLFNLKNILLILSLILIIIVIVTHCKNQIGSEEIVDESNYFSANLEGVSDSACNLSHSKDCTTCYKCIVIFFIAVVLGVIGIIINKKIK